MSQYESREQGPDLRFRYLRRAIWKGRDFSDSGILVQIEDVLMNFVGTTKFWNFMRTTINYGCSHEVGFLAFLPRKWH